MALINPALYSLPDTADQSAFLDCLCGALSDASLPDSVMNPFTPIKNLLHSTPCP